MKDNMVLNFQPSVLLLDVLTYLDAFKTFKDISKMSFKKDPSRDIVSFLHSLRP